MKAGALKKTVFLPIRAITLKFAARQVAYQKR
jgi:hypothetical protein